MTIKSNWTEGSFNIRRLGKLFRWRTVGIICVEWDASASPDDSQRGAHLESDVRQEGLGLIRIKCCLLDDEQARADGQQADRMYLIVGPVGDDHGRVRGTLAKRLRPRFALIKTFESQSIALFKFEPRARRAEQIHEAGQFRVNRISDYHKMLCGGEVGPGARAFSLDPPPTFFNRPAGWRRGSPMTDEGQSEAIDDG